MEKENKRSTWFVLVWTCDIIKWLLENWKVVSLRKLTKGILGSIVKKREKGCFALANYLFHRIYYLQGLIYVLIEVSKKETYIQTQIRNIGSYIVAWKRVKHRLSKWCASRVPNDPTARYPLIFLPLSPKRKTWEYIMACTFKTTKY